MSVCAACWGLFADQLAECLHKLFDLFVPGFAAPEVEKVFIAEGMAENNEARGIQEKAVSQYQGCPCQNGSQHIKDHDRFLVCPVKQQPTDRTHEQAVQQPFD